MVLLSLSKNILLSNKQSETNNNLNNLNYLHTVPSCITFTPPPNPVLYGCNLVLYYVVSVFLFLVHQYGPDVGGDMAHIYKYRYMACWNFFLFFLLIQILWFRKSIKQMAIEHAPHNIISCAQFSQVLNKE